MECRKEAAPMMVRDGATLMRGAGRREGGKRIGGGAGLMAGRSRRMERKCRCGTKVDRRSGKVDARQREKDGVLENCFLSCRERFRVKWLSKAWRVVVIFPLRQQLG
jgi:hypothetical protein